MVCRGTNTAVYDAPGDQALVEHEWCSTKAQINGSLCHITAIFGMSIAGLAPQRSVEYEPLCPLKFPFEAPLALVCDSVMFSDGGKTWFL